MLAQKDSNEHVGAQGWKISFLNTFLTRAMYGKNLSEFRNFWQGPAEAGRSYGLGGWSCTSGQSIFKGAQQCVRKMYARSVHVKPHLGLRHPAHLG